MQPTWQGQGYTNYCCRHQRGKGITAENPQAVLGETSNTPVGLIIPVRKTGAGRQVLGNVDKAAAGAAGIGFLYSDEVVVAHQLGNAIEIVETLRVVQNVFPAVRQILAVAPRLDADLDVIAEQPQCPLRNALNLLGVGEL